MPAGVEYARRKHSGCFFFFAIGHLRITGLALIEQAKKTKTLEVTEVNCYPSEVSYRSYTDAQTRFTLYPCCGLEKFVLAQPYEELKQIPHVRRLPEVKQSVHGGARIPKKNIHTGGARATAMVGMTIAAVSVDSVSQMLIPMCRYTHPLPVVKQKMQCHSKTLHPMAIPYAWSIYFSPPKMRGYFLDISDSYSSYSDSAT